MLTVGTTAPDRYCPSCGASLKPEHTVCPACGAPFSQVSAGRQQIELRELIENANQNLIRAGSEAAESAFGIGCSLGILLSVMIWLVAFALGIRNWIVLFLLALGIVLTGVGLSIVFSLRARAAAVARVFYTSALPQIEQYLQAHRLSSTELKTLAEQVLTPNAPLWTFLSSLHIHEQSE